MEPEPLQLSGQPPHTTGLDPVKWKRSFKVSTQWNKPKWNKCSTAGKDPLNNIWEFAGLFCFFLTLLWCLFVVMMHVTASNLRCNYALTVTHAFGLMWSSGALWHVQLDFKLIYVKNYVGVPLGKALCDTLKQIWNGKNNKLYKQLKVCFHLTDIHILVFFCTRESSACTLSSLKVKFSYLIVTNSFCTASKVSCAAISGHLQFHANKHRICPPMLWKLKFLLRTKNGAGQMFETFIQMDVLALFMRVCDDFTQWGHELLVGCFFSFFFFFF